MRRPVQATPFWRFLHALIELCLKHILCHLTIEGEAHIPLEGGCIIASNHNIGPDYVLLGFASTRQIYYMAKSEIFDIHPLLSRFLQEVGTFPIQRGSRDDGAITAAVELVQSNRVLGMFPEGTRSRDGRLQRGRSGVTRIAMRVEAPVVPAVVINGDKLFARMKFKLRTRPDVTVRFGPPITIPNNEDDAAAVKAGTEQIMLAIAALLPPELQGVYAASQQESQV